MLDYQLYDKLLWLYIIVIIISMLVIFLFAFLFVFVGTKLLQACKVISKSPISKRNILFLGLPFLLITLVMATPVVIDICANSYCKKEAIVSIEKLSEKSSSRRINQNHTLIIADNDGNTYECYDYVFDFENISSDSANCIVYAKHSKLLLDCFLE